ncbi:hypothetical protein CHS0354_011019 [Potamilus streckersoni]|uniref:Uncharacterized protein n=1 Tax=Potamilus streckersoni TaxID=2493646 RepID=A0AAE0WHG1_9BIVA|nr:hypothetical protein CHS0354_011019 [Potamilus streckersoni]
MNEHLEEEVHDLVLLFANSRIPPSSDAFATVLGEINLHDFKSNESATNKDTNKEPLSKTRNESRQSSADSPLSSNSAEAGNKEAAIEHPRQRVRWMDDFEQPLASVPSLDEKRHARLYMKTTPKHGILKREEDLNKGNDKEGASKDLEARRRVMSF